MQLTKIHLQTNSALPGMASYFWSIAINALISRFGTTALTLYDMVILLGLQRDGGRTRSYIFHWRQQLQLYPALIDWIWCISKGLYQ